MKNINYFIYFVIILFSIQIFKTVNASTSHTSETASTTHSSETSTESSSSETSTTSTASESETSTSSSHDTTEHTTEEDTTIVLECENKSFTKKEAVAECPCCI